MDIDSLREDIRAQEAIIAMMETVGWTEFVKPLLDEMITDVLGGQYNGKWYGGSMEDTSGLKLEQLVSYKKALIDFDNGIQNLLERGELAHQSIKEYEELLDGQQDYS